jgi:MFS transporter, DHA1 family, inner membrane transport protein
MSAVGLTTAGAVSSDHPMKLFSIMLLAFAGVLSQGLIPFIVRGLTSYAQLTTSQAGLCAGAEMGGSALGIAAVLFLLGQLSHRRLACGALLAVIAGNLLCIGASSVLAYCSARFLAGVGCGLTTAAFGMISTMSRPARNFALFSGSSVILMSAAQALIPALLARCGLPALFALIAAPAGIALFFVALIPNSAPAASHGALTLPSGAQRRRAILALLSNVAFFTSLAAFWTYVVEISVANGNAAARVTPIVAGGFLFGGIAGSVIAAAAGSRVRPFLPVALNSTVMAAAVAIMVWVPGFVVFSFSAVIFLLCWFTTYPFLMALLAEIDPAGGLTVMGVLAQSVGWLSGPVLGSALLARGAHGSLGWLSIGGFLLAAACASLVGAGSRTRPT